MRDAKGYYAVLEVEPEADQTQIKSSYRRLAKKYHPDSSAGLGDPQKIRLINQAYDIVGDPKKRADYDLNGLVPEPDKSSDKALDPIRCHVCSQIPAFPRYLVFWRVFSFLLATWSSPVQGMYCAKCAKNEAMRSTILTSIFGWWGFPWGPIMTIGKGFENALGGKGEQDRHEALAWYNALALLHSGQISMAVAIAEQLVGARDEEIRDAATALVETGRANGVTLNGHLKDPWRQVASQTPIRLGALFAAPTALILAIVVGSGTSGKAADNFYAASDQKGSAAARKLQPNDAQSEASSMPPPKPAEVCSTELENGRILFGRKNLASDGHALEISNGSAGDAIVKMRYSNSSKIYISFFVKQNQTIKIDGIHNGNYRIQYALGHALNKMCKKFISPNSVGEFPQIEPLRSEIVDDYRGQGIMYQRLSYTLYTVPGGNIRPETISKDAFDAD